MRDKSNKIPKPTRKKIITAYTSVYEKLSPLVNKLDLCRLSKHNKAYMRYAENPSFWFIEAEKKRYLKIAEFILADLQQRACPINRAKVLEVGAFIPVIPLLLKELGVKDVFVIEKFSLYGGALDLTKELLVKNKISIWELDVLSDALPEMQFDYVTLLAFIEHLNGSPLGLLNRLKKNLKPLGLLLVDTPNVACIEKRLTFLFRGKPPFPEIENYLISDYPFLGHNRECSYRELIHTLYKAGFIEEKFSFFNFGDINRWDLRTRIKKLIAALYPSLKDYMWGVFRNAETRT